MSVGPGNVSHMSSSKVTAPPEVAAAFAALDAAVEVVRSLDLDRLEPAVRLRALERLETARRRQEAFSHSVIAGLAEEDLSAVGGPVHKAVGDWLRISYAEARRRVRQAQQLAPRLSLTGEPMAPELPATAEAWQRGVLDGEHVRVIGKFLRDLPGATAVDIVERAERFLAAQAETLRPDQLAKVAEHYAARINPDGNFSDADRARQRGFSWKPQRIDGMSAGTLTATPRAARLPGCLVRPAWPPRACATPMVRHEALLSMLEVK